MSLGQKTRMYKKIALFSAVIFLYQIFFPSAVYALTSGPAQPEFSSFEPVATTNMVNDFTGDFTYNLPVLNIPGANGGGYALSLSYHSGGSPEEEASWVGYGWTLNPGSIVRNKRGFPDDWSGKTVRYWNKTPKNWTVSAGGSVNVELFSFDFPAGLNASLRYNNYKGFGYSAGAGIQLAKGVISIGYNVSNGEGSFSLSVNPAAALNKLNQEGSTDENVQALQASLKGLKGKKKAKALQAALQKNSSLRRGLKKAGGGSFAGTGIGNLSLAGSGYGILSHGSSMRATQMTEYVGSSWTLNANVMGTLLPIQAGPSFGLFGSYSEQKNEEVDDLNSFGYMYASAATDDDMMDYYVEKGSSYNKRDKFLGIPFSNADNYLVTGEGMGGGFRLFNKRAGHYHPNAKHSKTILYNIGVEIEAGLNFGGGGDVGVGIHDLKMGKWSAGETSTFAAPSDATDEPVMFRFNNDMGGSVRFGSTDEPERADINGGGLIGAKSYSASIDPDLIVMNDEDTPGGERSGRSSYIGYNTNSEIISTANGINHRVYAVGHVSQFVNRTSSELAEQVGEFTTVNEDGQRYVYGLPVYSRKEKNIQYGVQGLGAGSVDYSYIARKDISGNNEIQVGEERDAPYASMHLLTSIQSADYIDRTLDGPTDDDFGGWTKFIYAREHGGDDKVNSSSNDWYKWRIPYNGLLYSRNELSTPDDDMGSVMEGEKEIYYLDKVETKTYIAIFERSPREDGLDAEHDRGTASSSQTAAGSKQLSKLDKIRLYVKDESGAPGKLIRTINFKYNYSLCPFVTNNSGVFVDDGDGGDLNANQGKLTLTKVWFEHEGIVNATISPYKFEYKYPDTSDPDFSGYPAPYNINYSSDPENGIQNYGNLTEAQQNPIYSPFDIDAWGNYQENGLARYDRMQSWLSQAPSAAFDPAAWQLKVIKLPSGGEIHVQYEQDEYAYVQDEKAHALVGLLESLPGQTSSNEPSDFPAKNRYYLDVASMGLTDSDLPALRNLINTDYVQTGKKMYFRFLYKLIGTGNPDLDNCNAEYITGYVNVKQVSIETVGTQDYVMLKLGGTGSVHDKPRNVCKDLVKTQKAGNLSIDGNICDPSIAGVNNANGPEEVIKDFLGFTLSFAFPASTCTNVNMDESYLRIPMLAKTPLVGKSMAKKGGGIRVKRLMMYDKGIETGYPSLFGSEYEYETLDDFGDRISSGVATNEPQAIREENILVQFLERFEQKFGSKVISGRDKKQAEGPLGESIMPSPSIGYSKVIIKSIHSGKTNTGYTIKEFHTADGFFNADEDMTSIKTKKDYLLLPLGLVNRYVNNSWLSQGFSFKIDNMHGQPKSVATYGGDYSDVLHPDKATLATLEEFRYFEEDEAVPMWNGFDKAITYENPGKETEVVFETRMVSDINNDGNVEGDVDGGIFGVIVLPFATFFPSLTFAETELYTHVTTKIIRTPAIVKSTKIYRDGIYHLTENKLFNPLTGKPIVTRTTDAYDDLSLLNTTHEGAYTSYTIPATQEYDAVGPKSQNERKVIRSIGDLQIDKIISDGTPYLSFSCPACTTSTDAVCNAMGSISSGDLVKVGGDLYHLGPTAGSTIELLPLDVTLSSSSVLNGLTATNIEIIKSGYTNQLSLEIGSVTSYGESITKVLPLNDPSHPDNAEFVNREGFANLLNGILTGGGVIAPEEIPSGLEFVDVSSGNCPSTPEVIQSIVQTNDIGIALGTAGTTNYIANSIFQPTGTPNPGCNSINSFYVGNVPPWITTHGSPSLGTFNSLLGSHVVTLVGSAAPKGEGIRQEITSLAPGENYMLSFDYRIDPSSSVDRLSIVLSDNLDVVTDPNPPNCQSPNPVISSSAQYLIGGTPGNNNGLIYSGNFEHMDVPFTYSSSVNNQLLIFPLALNNNNSILVNITNVEINNVDNLCTDLFPVSGGGEGNFSIDPNTGQLIYFTEDNPCFPQEISCLQFCNEIYPVSTISNVVASSASTLSDDWGYDENIYFTPSGNGYNAYETGERGKWRQQSSFVFKSEIKGIDGPYTAHVDFPYTAISDQKIYNAGTYSFELYNYNVESANNPSKWLKLSTVTKVSPNGNPVEEENILGIKSAAKFGYNGTAPYLVGQNTDHQSTFFESFEKLYDDGLGNFFFEEGLRFFAADGDIVSSTAHSGGKSLRLKSQFNGFNLHEATITNQLLDEGLSVKVWVKSDLVDRTLIETNLRAEFRKGTSSGAPLISEPFTKIAQTGEWGLYEAVVSNLSSNYVIGEDYRTFIKYNFQSGTENIWIDDVRMQSLDAQMICYVYDVNTLRLLTSFDDQHFGLFYQYNAEGKLVRKLIETERGIKTVQETQYNTPLQSR